ncbi:MAG: hypothetical protein QXP81_10400 [Nitrososphaerota archaeon]
MKPNVKVLTLKSLMYRVFVVSYELGLGLVLSYFGVRVLDSAITAFVLINNLIKFFGYLIFELIWVGYLRTRFNVIGRILRRLNDESR